jgi:hypothetical protein
MLDIMNKLTQLSEAVKDTGKGKIHTSEPGGYGRKDDEDEKGKLVKPVSTEKKGRGRPKKDADSSTGEEKKYDAKGLSSVFGGKAPKSTKKGTVIKGKSQSHTSNKDDDGTGDEEPKAKAKSKSNLKDWIEQINRSMIAEQSSYTTAPMPGAVAVKDAAGKVVATAKNPQAAAAFQKGDITISGEEGMAEGEIDEMYGPYDDDKVDTINAANPPKAPSGQPNRMTPTPAVHHTYDRKAVASNISGKDSAAYDQYTGRDKVNEKDIGKHNNATTGFDALVRKLTPKYGVEAAKRIAGAQMKKIKEADMPPHDSLASPLSMEESKMPMKKVNGKSVPAFAADGKGKNDLKNKKVEEAMDSASKTGKKKCPPMLHVKKMCEKGMSVAEICKMHPDCDRAELKQMVADCKKKMVKEGMNQQLQAARSEGKAHGLRGHSHCGKNYEDMEEARCYHEGYKEGLDECYGQMPIQGYVGENDTVNDMASYGAHTPTMEDDMYEMDKTSYMKQQAIKTPGDTFNAFGQTFKDKEVLESPFAFEAWEKELNALLESKADVAEGMTVSISKGQQGAPDSVSVSAQDGDADQLLGIIKSAGLGLFGGDDQNGYGAPQGTTAAPGGIEVVDDHDGMMALMKKLTGQGGSSDYADEEHSSEETCESCGEMMEAGHSCGSAEMVDEVESEDQMTYNVAEDNPPDSGAADTDAEIADTQQANASASSYDEAESEDEAASDNAVAEESEPGVEESEEQVEESLANDNDDQFEADIDFMTNVISGGLNNRKSTGQSTIPVVSTQVNRLGNPMRESTDLLHDWKKLSGIK